MQALKQVIQINTNPVILAIEFETGIVLENPLLDIQVLNVFSLTITVQSITILAVNSGFLIFFLF